MIKTVNLKKHFHIGRNQTLHALDGISLTIAENEILGLVGESGSGRCWLQAPGAPKTQGLYQPNLIASDRQ